MKAMRWIGLAAAALSVLPVPDARAQPRASGVRTPCPANRGISRYNPRTYGGGGPETAFGVYEELAWLGSQPGGGLVLTVLGPAPPELGISSIVLSPSSPSGQTSAAPGGVLTPGALFTVVVTGGNASPAPCGGGRLAVWLDRPYWAGPGLAGDVSTNLPALDGCSTAQSLFQASFVLTAPSIPGSYVLRAFVDADDSTREGYELNNQSTLSYQVVAPGPDFVITDVSFSPAALREGEYFTAYATVKNQGSATGDAGFLEAWSAHVAAAGVAVPTATPDAWARVGNVAPGVSTNVVLTGLMPPAAGSYGFLAVVDSRAGTVEQNETNNSFLKGYTVEP